MCQEKIVSICFNFLTANLIESDYLLWFLSLPHFRRVKLHKIRQEKNRRISQDMNDNGHYETFLDFIGYSKNYSAGNLDYGNPAGIIMRQNKYNGGKD